MIRRSHSVALVAAAFSLCTACGDSSAQGEEAASSIADEASAEPQSASGTQPAPRVDLLTAARGASLFFASTDAPGALALIDGDRASHWSTATVRNPAPHSFVVELMAPAVLEKVGVDGAGERPGGVAGGSAGTVRVEGSADGPDTGFRPLATFQAAAEGETVVQPRGEGKVRWLRFTIEGAQNEDANFLYLDELVAYGTLDPVEESGRFAGTFQTGRANFVRLAQNGPLVTGCYIENGGRSSGVIDGAIVDGVALVNWTSEQGISGTALFTRTAAGELDGMRYRQRSRTSWGGPVADGEAQVSCGEEAANPVAEALQEDGFARLYGIHFAYDSDVPKPSAKAALEQLRDALASSQALNVVIEGHTDADGADRYNTDLSRRRAEAVVRWLVEQGISADRLTAVGKGESEPVASNETADGRALNRRVEVRRVQP